MSNKKQSSIDWLMEKIQDQRERGETDLRTTLFYCEQAKAMHKEEIAKSYFEGENRKWNSVNGYEYYNETFGGSHE